MAIWVCSVCGWEYNEDEGLPDDGFEPGTKFEDLPEDFECPVCGAPKSDFNKQ
ncbi:MAG: rubredoxin [Promethearchaeota archaeon]